MITCSCGALLGEKRTQCARCEALQVLGLEKDAVESEVRAAYRMLVKVLHPHQFRDDEKLREAAEEKLKAATNAHDYLTSTSIQLGLGERPVNAEPFKAFQQSQPVPAPTPAVVAPPVAAPVASPTVIAAATPPLSRWAKIKLLYTKAVLIYRRARLIFRIAAVVFVLITGRAVWMVHRPANQQVAEADGSGQEKAPKESFMDSVKRELRKMDPSYSEPTAEQQTPQTAPQAPDNSHPKKASAIAQKATPTPRKVYSYVTVGSTKDEVIAQQGTPTAISDDKLVYGNSELYLKDGVVVGWRIDPYAPTIRVKLWPQSSVDPEPGYFAVGSTRDFVLTVQGTPTAFSENKFEYGGSVVYFQNNRVVSWKNDPASIPLRVR